MDCIAQTEPLITKDPPDKFKKFIKVKQKLKCNGIENVAFQDEADVPKLKTSNSLEELRTEKKDEFDQSNTGVKKKSITGLTRSESTNISGAKKKIRSASKSPSKVYYQIWTASSDKTKEVENVFNSDEEAPPLPPRSCHHRPLKRSHALNATITPPVVLRQNKPKIQKPEDTFGFELIDTDETKRLSPETKTFLAEEAKKHIGNDNYITTVFGKNPNTTSPTHEILEQKNSQSSLSTQSNSSLDAVDGVSNTEPALKPHKPLCRQTSNELKAPVQEKTSSSSETTSEEACGVDWSLQNEPKTPLHLPKINENKDIVRPHPKALTRVAGLTNSLPVCPPTPTHHSRRLRNANLRPPNLKAVETDELVSHLNETRTADASSEANIESNSEETRNLHPILMKREILFNPRLSLRALTEMHIDQVVPEDTDSIQLRLPDCADGLDGEASGGIPLPLRHLRSTRLPSIPERSHRVLAISELPGEHEDPLPPCKEIDVFVKLYCYC